MADKEKYMIKVGGKLVEVTPDVYYAYFRIERQERCTCFPDITWG